MYNGKNIRKTILFMILFTFLLSGCKNKNSTKEIISNDLSLPTTTQTVSITPTLTPTPTMKPSASITMGEEITAIDAKAILEEHLATTKYSVELLSETVDIDNQQFIAFIASKDATQLEPILIVNKYSGEVSCMSKSGKLIAFSSFPSNSQDDMLTFDWNGNYYMKDKFEQIVGVLQIVQNDSSSFEFIVERKDSVTSSLLAGIGHISDEGNAIFIDESNNELLFMIEEDAITLCDNEAFSNNGLSIEGTYNFEGYDAVDTLRITSDKALELISDLSMLETKLPADISEYTIIANKNTVIVQNRICYQIGAYAKLEDRNVLMTTFYVSVDGNITFAYDNLSNNTYSTIKLFK